MPTETPDTQAGTARNMRFANQSPLEVLGQNSETVSPFHAAKTKREAAKNWNRFYMQHKDRFFKDRHWTTREFEDLAELGVDDALGEGTSASVKGKNKVLLEVGCGAGNCIWPLVQRFPDLQCHACDFSQEAVDLVKSHASYTPERIHAFVHDLTQSEPLLADLVGAGQIDVCTCLFTLSAIPPEKQEQAIQSIAGALRPGGVVLFRDYALHDSAQLRFHTRASANYSEPSLMQKDAPLYRRADQTLSYFFTSEEVDQLFGKCGLVGSSRVTTRSMENRKEQWCIERRFIQGRFVKAAPLVAG